MVGDRDGHALAEPPRANERADWALGLFGLLDQAARRPSELSQGQRKLVGVARALAAGPKLVLLDEPAAGLDTAESEVLGEHLRGLLDHGITVLLVDHDMGLVLGVCDTIWVLEFGRIIARCETGRHPLRPRRRHGVSRGTCREGRGRRRRRR